MHILFAQSLGSPQLRLHECVTQGYQLHGVRKVQSTADFMVRAEAAIDEDALAACGDLGVVDGTVGLPPAQRGGGAFDVAAPVDSFAAPRDTDAFLSTLERLAALDSGSGASSCMGEQSPLDEEVAAGQLFDWSKDLVVTRAPGRLDVMGGACVALCSSRYNVASLDTCHETRTPTSSALLTPASLAPKTPHSCSLLSSRHRALPITAESELCRHRRLQRNACPSAANRASLLRRDASPGRQDSAPVATHAWDGRTTPDCVAGLGQIRPVRRSAFGVNASVASALLAWEIMPQIQLPAQPSDPPSARAAPGLPPTLAVRLECKSLLSRPLPARSKRDQTRCALMKDLLRSTAERPPSTCLCLNCAATAHRCRMKTLAPFLRKTCLVAGLPTSLDATLFLCTKSASRLKRNRATPFSCRRTCQMVRGMCTQAHLCALP